MDMYTRMGEECALKGVCVSLYAVPSRTDTQVRPIPRVEEVVIDPVCLSSSDFHSYLLWPIKLVGVSPDTICQVMATSRETVNRLSHSEKIRKASIHSLDERTKRRGESA